MRVEHAASARGYAPDAIVPAVASTPTRNAFVAAAAARAPGSITPSTGRSSSTRRRSGATALTVLHATTIALTPRATRWVAQVSAYFVTVAAPFVPYGTRAV